MHLVFTIYALKTEMILKIELGNFCYVSGDIQIYAS